MTHQGIAAVAMAAMLVLAGCSGAPGGGSGTAETGTVSFYVSDQPNAIDDFEHLNVTITEVAFASGTSENSTSGNETDANSTTAEDGAWETYDVNATVDLTQYRGANATLLGNLSVPEGDYSTVKMEVSTVEGTLENGSETEVKLPSGGLNVPKGMTVSADEPVSFVFDVSVVKAGNSGGHILKPVVGESGTDVPIEVRERKGGPNDRGNAGGPDRGDDSDDDSTTESDDSTTQTSADGKMNFYVSDERNAISDFEHLNVTISSVGLHTSEKTDDSEEADEETGENDTDENETTVENDTDETESPNGALALQNDTTENETEDAEENETEIEDSENETEDTEENETEIEDPEGETEENETEDESESESGGWQNYEVDNATVDLTQYQGANATRIADFGVPNATYDKVFVHVEEVNGTLADGTQVNVKLPSEKLQIKNEFTVGNNESVDFVFDITVFQTGNKDRYILKPVVSESGTDVAIEKPDEAGQSSEQKRNGEDRRQGGERGPQDERTMTTTEAETTETTTTETTSGTTTETTATTTMTATTTETTTTEATTSGTATTTEA